MPSIRIECPKTHTNFGELFYPGLMVDVWLPSKGYQPFEFILDSGADCTVVPLDMSHLVGYHLPKKPDATISGIINKPIEDAIISFKDNEFDLIFTMAVLVHIHPDVEQLFEHIVRVTKEYLILIEDEISQTERHTPRSYKEVFEICRRLLFD